jgi:hypothetical protein
LKWKVAIFAAVTLTACNPVASAEPKDRIVGRWESKQYSVHKQPLFAEFSSDGTLKFTGPGGPDKGLWTFINTGELQMSYPGNNPFRCQAKFDDSGPTLLLTLTPPTCLFGWEDMGTSITLERQ